MSSWRRAERSSGRWVKTARMEPTARAATALSATEATMAPLPLVISHGSSGMNAPRAKVANEASADLQGRAQMLGADAQLLAGVGLERQLRVRHDLVHHVAGHLGIDPPLLVYAAQLVGLPGGALFERHPLDLELALHELALRRHGEVLARRHGEGARHQPGHADQADDVTSGAGARHTEHQRDVGDQAVAQPEHRRPRSSTPDVAMLVRLGEICGHWPQRSDAALP